MAANLRPKSYPERVMPSKAQSPPPETEVDVNWPSLFGAPDRGVMHNSQPDLEGSPSVRTFLANLNLEAIIPLFVNEGINLDKMSEMDHEDLKSIGVSHFKRQEAVTEGTGLARERNRPDYTKIKRKRTTPTVTPTVLNSITKNRFALKAVLTWMYYGMRVHQVVTMMIWHLCSTDF